MSRQQRPEQTLTNQDQIEEALKKACEECEPLHDGYGDEVYQAAIAALALVLEHESEPFAVNQRIQEYLGAVGGEVHGQIEAAKGSGEVID